MTKRDLEDIRRKLVAERDRVSESLRRSSRYALSETDDTTRDAVDLASASHDRHVLYRLQESDTRRLRIIDEVLSRIDRDGYGICGHCGASCKTLERKWEPTGRMAYYGMEGAMHWAVSGADGVKSG